MKKLIVFTLLLLFTACACKVYQPIKTGDLVITPADGPVETDFVSFNQGWDWKTSNSFWFTSQGSEIIPYTWFTWLEQPNNQNLFRNTTHMKGLGYLPVKASKQNPSGLPIGFAMSQSPMMKDAYMGFTCAACHTNMIEYGGKKFMIDGAPTLGNFVGFFKQLVDALNQTSVDDVKFARFANRVLGDTHTAADADQLREKLLAVAEGTALRQDVNKLPDHYPSDFTSYARLDAFTNIMNAGSAFALDMPNNKNYPIAPVSYPFLWGTHQSDVVQWNGSAPNIPRSVGPMVRNAGEVVGVFGGLTIVEDPDHNGKFNYKSSVDFPGLGRLEGFVKSLKAPRWNDAKSNLPPVKPGMVANGKILYKANCGRCHTVIPRGDQLENYTASMIALEEVGTDPISAWAGDHYMASTGILEGSRAEVLAGDIMGDSVRAITIPVNGVIGLMLRSPSDVLKGIIFTDEECEEDFQENVNAYSQRRDSMAEASYQESGDQEWDVTQNTPTDLNLHGLKYKARPLNGIWATAPYLHNGSVPNLWELLQAPTDRMKSFWVGSRKFDAKNVGFVTNQGKNEFRVMDSNGEIMLGNSNLGHNYGGPPTDGQGPDIAYTPQEKWDIIEYMKTL